VIEINRLSAVGLSANPITEVVLGRHIVYYATVLKGVPALDIDIYASIEMRG
jgi:hypothetical protein